MSLDNSNFFVDNSLISNTVLNKDKIDKILTDLNNSLKDINKSLEITIYGGSCLCLLNKFRDSTYDIDTISNDNKLLMYCIDTLGLTRDLINTEIEVFLTRNESLELYKEFSNLKVWLPTLEYLFAMKIRASRDKDFDDCVNLAKLLNVDSLDKIKNIFVKHYSPIQFNFSKVEFSKKVLKEVL